MVLIFSVDKRSHVEAIFNMAPAYFANKWLQSKPLQDRLEILG
jgi:hypothetical protein